MLRTNISRFNGDSCIICSERRRGQSEKFLAPQESSSPIHRLVTCASQTQGLWKIRQALRTEFVNGIKPKLVGSTGTCSHRRSSQLASLRSTHQQKTSPIQASVVCLRDSSAQTEPTDDQMPSLNPSTETESPHILQRWNVTFQFQPGDWTSVWRPARSERCSYESRRTFQKKAIDLTTLESHPFPEAANTDAGHPWSPRSDSRTEWNWRRVTISKAEEVVLHHTMHLGHLELNPAVVAEVIPAFTEIKIPMQLPKKSSRSRELQSKTEWCTLHVNDLINREVNKQKPQARPTSATNLVKPS